MSLTFSQSEQLAIGQFHERVDRQRNAISRIGMGVRNQSGFGGLPLFEKSGGIICAKSCFIRPKCAVLVNTNMTTMA